MAHFIYAEHDLLWCGHAVSLRKRWRTIDTEDSDAVLQVCHQLVQALDLRWKWLFRPNALPEHDTVRPFFY